MLAPNSGLSHRITSTGSNRRVTVTMTFSVVCQQHCYGRDCLTVCRPQNDQNGHFSCSQTDGSHVCLPNYYSLPNCLVFCEATDNSNGHFTCNPNDGSHVCLPNYYGLPNCLTFCQPQDDDQNGHYTCNQADGSRECLENFYGPDCLVFCRASNNDSDGHYTCDPRNGTKICNVGFTNPEDSCRESELLASSLFCEAAWSTSTEVDHISAVHCGLVQWIAVILQHEIQNTKPKFT